MSTEQVGLTPTNETSDSPKKRTRDSRPLKWYERQYGAGLVAGLSIGVCIGIPLDAAVAVAAKWFVTWLWRF